MSRRAEVKRGLFEIDANGVYRGREIRHDQCAPDDVTVPPRLRAEINENVVCSLTESIRSIGLQTPIVVREIGEGDEYDIVLVTGLHRLEACKRLGINLMPCRMFDGNETEARMWEITENLHRAELTPVERAEHVAEWIRLRDLQSAQVDPIESKRSDGRGHRPRSGINEAARQLGIDRRAVQRALKIASLKQQIRDQAREEGWSQTKLLHTVNPVPPARPVRNELEAEEAWITTGIRWWNTGSKKWRERFLERVADATVFDNGGAA
jgi:ParB-like chromosome segregation protein Spo0J